MNIRGIRDILSGRYLAVPLALLFLAYPALCADKPKTPPAKAPAKSSTPAAKPASGGASTSKSSGATTASHGPTTASHGAATTSSHPNTSDPQTFRPQSGQSTTRRIEDGKFGDQM